MPCRNLVAYVAGGALIIFALLACAEKPQPSAREQLETRAQHGEVDAMLELGDANCCGVGKDKNEEQAIAWFCQAARQGNAQAMLTLGRIYQENNLPLAAAARYQYVRVRKDNSVAYAWYKIAAQHSNKLAATSLELLKRVMNNTQMDQGETLVLDPRTIPCQYQGQTL